MMNTSRRARLQLNELNMVWVSTCQLALDCRYIMHKNKSGKSKSKKQDWCAYYYATGEL